MSDWDALERKYSGGTPAAPAAADPWADIEQKYAGAPAVDDSAPAAIAPQPKSQLAPLSRMDKYKRGLRDPIDGGAQFLTNMLPDGLVKGVNNANNWLADKTGLVGRLPEGGIDQQVRESQAKYEGQRAAQGETGFDGYRMLGNVFNPVNLAAASRVPAVASLAELARQWVLHQAH